VILSRHFEFSLRWTPCVVKLPILCVKILWCYFALCMFLLHFSLHAYACSSQCITCNYILVIHLIQILAMQSHPLCSFVPSWAKFSFNTFQLLVGLKKHIARYTCNNYIMVVTLCDQMCGSKIIIHKYNGGYNLVPIQTHTYQVQMSIEYCYQSKYTFHQWCNLVFHKTFFIMSYQFHYLLLTR
jgi:hypothetical protein